MKSDKMAITPEQLEYLQSKGWIITKVDDDKFKYTTYIHPKYAPQFRGGGFCDPLNAIEAQNEQDAYDLGKCYYHLINDNHGGYGYTIYERNPTGKKRLVFNHHDESISREMVDKLKKDGKCEQVILDTSHVYHHLLILEEKHGTRHYYVPNLPCLFKTCRSIVMERIDDEHFSEIEKPSLNKEDIEKMKDGAVKRAANEEWKHYETSLRYRNEEKEQSNAIKFIKENDNLLGGKKAYLLLRERNGCEYEAFKMEYMNYIK